jgi:hypothetical protein
MQHARAMQRPVRLIDFVFMVLFLMVFDINDDLKKPVIKIFAKILQ